MHSPTLIVRLPIIKFSNKVVPKFLSNISRNRPFLFFASFLIVSLTPFINKPESSSNLTVFLIPFVSSFEIINPTLGGGG